MKLVMFAALVFAVACGGGSKEEPAGPRKLSKLDVRVAVDGKGRIKPMFQLYDQKLKPVKIAGSYSVSVARADGAELCKLTGTFEPADFTDNEAYRAQYRDASCPEDPGATDLKISVVVQSPDKTIERTLAVPARLVYENLKPPMPPAGSGSAVGSGSGSASVPAEAPVGSGSAAKPARSAGSGSSQSETAGPGKT